VKGIPVFGIIALLAGTAVTAMAENNQHTLVVTASNAKTNQLLVYSTGGQLVQTVSTKGQGGAGGNAGGIAAKGGLLAVVNFGSQSVSLFDRADNGFRLRQTISTAPSPVSVAFGHDHLYVLGATTIESHRFFGSNVSAGPDGMATLLKADGSSAQVGFVEDHLIVTEKSNVIETVALNGDGAVTGAPTLVQNIPTNVNTPFGLVTRGNNAYVTIAHADETSLVRNGQVLTTTPTTSLSGPVQHSPCWLALVGPFLYSSNSPSSTISRYAVYGQKIVPDQGVAATLNGAPTDIASGDGLVAVIDGNGPVSHLSVFHVDEDGNLTLQGAATIAGAANGVAVVGAVAKGDN
jgi:hypothetical protein